MRIEITEKRISDTDAATGQHYQLSEGDIVTVPDAYGARLCALGWAKDVAGVVPTGERKPGADAVVPKKLTISSRGTT